QAANEQGRISSIYLQNARKDNSRSINGNAGGYTALYKEQKCSEDTCFYVESFFQVFIGGKDPHSVKNSDKSDAQYDHRQGYAEVELCKAHTRGISKSGS